MKQNKMADWMENTQWMAVVMSSFLFTGLEDESLVKSLLNETDCPVNFKKGEYIYRQKTFRRAIGIVLDGCVEILHEDEGRRVLMNQLESGGIFGAAAMFDNSQEYVTDIRAVRACTILFLPQERLTEMMRQEYSVAENYIRFLSGRIRFLNHRIAGFTGGAADRRLARYLIEHRDADGVVMLPRSMVALAAALNVGRSSLYRSLDEMTASGIISRTEKGITIVDLHRLEMAAG